MRRLDVRFTRAPRDSLPVGTLAEDRRRVFFQYHQEFLATKLNLSPFTIPLRPELFEHKDLAFGPLPGLFDDSLPDGWGMLLMDRHFRRLGHDTATISPLDRLAWLGSRTMGALTYHPPSSRTDEGGPLLDLHELARQSQQVLAGKAVDVLPQLLRAGGTPGGARPKVLVGVKGDSLVSGEDDLPEGFEHWIVKFHTEAEGPDAGPIEYAYALMAAASGIDMPPVRLFETAEGDRFFGVKRFDRDGNRRFHVHTFGNLIQSNFRIPSMDYTDLLRATGVLTRNQANVRQAFRRMVFNVLAHNRDDHVKNFAFLLDDSTGNWSLSPAYDLLWTAGPGGEHTMTVAGEGRSPTREHLLKVADREGVPARQAAAVINEVGAAVARWKRFASESGVSKSTCRRIEGRLYELK